MNTTTATVLRGPADPEQFRVKVGRFAERHYVDPLPACPIADQYNGDPLPSVTTILGAWPKHLDRWAATCAAEFAYDEHHRWLLPTGRGLEPMERDAAVKLIAGEHIRRRVRAAGRGSAAHQWLEATAQGDTTMAAMAGVPAEYIPALEALLADTTPTWVLSEVVVINRTIGYGGTADAMWHLELPTFCGPAWIDFRTSKDHTAYPDKAAQVAGYGLAEYMIVNHGGRAVRAHLPACDAGIVITITPDGYKLHPVNVEHAQTTWVAVRHFWACQRTSLLGTPLHVDPAGSAFPAGPTGGSPAPPVSPAPAPTTVSPPQLVPGTEAAPSVPAPAGDNVVFLCARPSSQSRIVQVPPTTPVEPAAPSPVAAGQPEAGQPARIGTLLPQVIAGIPDEPVAPLDLGPAHDPDAPCTPDRHTWIRDRVQSVKDAGHLDALTRAWPQGVPGFLVGHHHTNAEVDLLDRICWQVETAHTLPFPEPQPDDPSKVPADHPTVVDTATRFAALPADLQADVAAEMATRNLPKITSGQASPEQVAMVAGWVQAVEARLGSRTELVAAHLAVVAGNGANPDVFLHAATGGRTVDPAALTQWEADRVGDLVDAVALGWLDADLTAPDLPGRLGGRAEAVKAAKAAAAALGIKAPTSADAVAGSPLLVAHIALNHTPPGA